jgi:CRISPR/Cas system-associated protein Csm6
MGVEGDRFATVCLQLISQAPRDASAQLDTVDGVGTATGMKNNNY